jgi:hypothetical protein
LKCHCVLFHELNCIYTQHTSLASLAYTPLPRYCHAAAMNTTNPQRWPRSKTTTTLKPNTTYWDHPNPSQANYLTPLTRVLTTPDHIPPNYRPSPSDWTRIPWVHNQQAQVLEPSLASLAFLSLPCTRYKQHSRGDEIIPSPVC